MRLITTLFCIALFSANAAAHDPAAKATYLGNEGVLVARGETKILFDAFYANSYDGTYTLVPDEISQAMMEGTPPYNGIDAIFVSHIHGDHFTAEPAIAYMRAQEGVYLYAPAAARQAFLDAGVDENDPIMARVRTYDLAPNMKPISFDIGGLSVDAISVPHQGNWGDLQNFIWRVTLDDKTTVMHLGDASVDVASFESQADYFKAKKTGAAFMPYWFYRNDDGALIMETMIKADQYIGVHVPASSVGQGDEWRARAGGDLFTDPGETRDLGGIE